MRRVVEALLAMSLRQRIVAITVYALFLAAVGIEQPALWLLPAGILAVSATNRSAAVVASWTALLIVVHFILLGTTQGMEWPRLLLSAVYLACLPAVAKMRERAMTHQTRPGVQRVTTSSAKRPAALATSRAPGEVAAATHVDRSTTRVMIGACQGDIRDPVTLSRSLERSFRVLGASGRRALPELARDLDALVAAQADSAHVAATLVEITSEGQVAVLQCGGPQIVAVPNASVTGRPKANPAVYASGGDEELSLGSGTSPWQLSVLPYDMRVAVVSAAFAGSHDGDFVSEIGAALRSGSLEFAAVKLMTGTADANIRVPSGAALVIESL